MPDRQFPAKQAERDEHSVAEESRITSGQPRLSEGERGKKTRMKDGMKKREYKVETWSALLAAVSREYLKKRGEHGDKNVAMTAEKDMKE